MARLFGRQLRLVIADAAGGSIDLGRLSCKFDITRTSESGLNRAKVTVFNLSDATIDRISEKYLGISVEAGYGDRFASLFRGQIKYVFPTQEGPNRLVEIFAADGARAYENARVATSFAIGTSLRTVVATLAATFGDVTMAADGLSGLTDVQLTGALVESDHTRDVLNRLAEAYGFVWSIQSGALHVRDRGRSLGVAPIKVSRETGMIGTPFANNIGIQVRTLLHPGIVPGVLIDVQTAGARSQISEAVLVGGGIRLVGLHGGTFRVLRCSHVGETRGQSWYTEAFATLPLGG